ncbi:MAG: two-component regulator propeller domain-containing protein [Candidatus Krumholzibacteriia bacterium]
MLAVLAGLLAAAAPSSAQVFHVVTYNEQDGLPSAEVRGLAQDADGCLWLATRNGIARYDGLEWVTSQDGEEFAGVPISCLSIDAAGDIWGVAHRFSRLILREGGRWHSVALRARGEGFQEIHTVLPAPRQGDQRRAVLLSTEGQAFLLQDAVYEPIELPGGPGWLASGCWAGDMVLLASDRGLYRLTGLAATPRAELVAAVPAEPVFAVLAQEDPDSRSVLLVGETWLGRLDGNGFTRLRTFDSLELPWAAMGVAVAADAAGWVYVGDRARIYELAPSANRPRELATRNGLASNGATGLLVDRAGPVWFASLRGLSKLIDRRVASFDRRHGLLDDEVSAVLARSDGTITLGHPGGLTLMNEPPRTIAFAVADPHTARVADLLEDGAGTVWVAAGLQGLGRLDQDRRVDWLSADLGLAAGIYALAEDPAGRLWVGGAAGLWSLDATGAHLYPLEERLPGPVPLVRRFLVARDGSLWVATGNRGVLRIEGASVRNVTAGDDLLDSVYSLAEAADGRIYAATSRGLAEVQGDRLVRCNRPSLDRPAFAVTVLPDGQLWVGTDQGVRIWDGRTLGCLTVRDGLFGAEVNRDALTLDPAGRMWVGTDRGVTTVDLAQDGPPPFAPSARIVSVVREGRPLALDGPLEVPVGAGELSFAFRSTPFRDEHRLLFRTWLEGFDADWRPAGAIPTQSVRYTNLPPGRYRFHVQAVDPGQPDGAPAVTPVIVIQPPIWRRLWFVALEAAVGLALLALVVATWQSRRYAGRLEREVAARTRELTVSEAAVRRESERLATVLASISDAVVAVDGRRRVVMANPAVARLTGRPAAQILGCELAELFPGLPAGSAEPAEGTNGPGADQAGPVFSYRLPARGAAEPCHLEVAVARLAGSGDQGPGLVLAFRDVTDRLRLEQARVRTQKLESLGVLAGGLAHDFNNLMMVMLGHVSMLEESDTLDPDGRASLQRMRATAEKAQALTGQLITFARGGAPRKQPTDLAELVRGTAGLICAGIDLEPDFDLPDGLQCVEVDRGQLEQVISNLLINAHQAMPGGGRVWIRGRNLDRDGAAWVELSVRDEGPGVPAAIAEQIFEPYFSTKDAGAGLGLTTCYSVLTRHGGSLRYESPAGGGAEFILRLPAAGRTSAAEAIPPREEPATGLHVLVLDDEDAVRDIMARMVRSLGHRCTAVADGEAAIAAYREARDAGRPFDLVVIDLTLGSGLDGQQTFAALRELDPRVRAIVASGYSHDPVMSDFAAHGFTAALAKPFDRQALIRALATVTR